MASCVRLFCFEMLLNSHKQYILTQNLRGFHKWLVPTLIEMKKKKDKMGPQLPERRSNFIEWNYNAELFAFGKRLNEEFRRELLLQALTERSYINEEVQKQKTVGIEDPQLQMKDNVELIEEGNAIMRSYILRFLRQSLPLLPEEGIQAIGDYLMSEDLLSNVSSLIGTKDIILSAEYPPSKQTLTNALKALVAALSQSSGIKQAEIFVRDLVITQLSGKDLQSIWFPKDPMKTLCDIFAREGRSIPEPRLAGSLGRNTVLASYQVVIYEDKNFIGSGFGETIDEAKQVAAGNALRKLFGTTDNMIPFCFTADPTTAHTNQNLSLEEWTTRRLENIAEV